jgi:hypothetical protein
MKKYKLIKEYPNSPKLGTEIIESFKSENSRVTSFSYRTFIIKDEDYFQLKNPKEYPEFWEEVIEKDYKILSFKNNHAIVYIQKDGKYSCSMPNTLSIGHCTSEEMLKLNDNYQIHSIKRLSDGEIFTIDDIIIYNEVFPTKLKIKSFQIFNNELLVHKDYTMNTNKLSEIKHIKQPLFKTEDGVEIFEGNEVFYVFNDLTPVSNEGYKYKWTVYPAGKQYINNNVGNNYYKIFSTKKAAEEYISMNKPCLSYNDILKIIDNSSKLRIDLVRNLKNLVKK